MLRRLEVKADEMASFVQKKANKQWIWIAMDATSRQVIAFHVGDHSHRSAKRLWAKIPHAYRQHATFYTDQYVVYEGVIPAAQHRAISKLAHKTNHIERFNNTLRQRVSRLVREALSFSKKLANHIGAIKLFICHYNLNESCSVKPALVGQDRARCLTGPFPHPPRENRADGFPHTTAHARRTSVGSSFAGLSRCIPPDYHPVRHPTTTASPLRRFPLYTVFPRSAVGRYSHEYSRRSATSHPPGFGPYLALFPHRALPISGFVPARASEGSARVSPDLLAALLRIPCKVSRVPYHGLCNVG
jgi:insertion element IS1 protein InsB